MDINNCPECKIELPKNYGLMGLVYRCPKCDKEWVKCLDKLVGRDEFHARADAEHY